MMYTCIKQLLDLFESLNCVLHRWPISPPPQTLSTWCTVGGGYVIVDDDMTAVFFAGVSQQYLLQHLLNDISVV